jgi:transcriptional regulator with XRE-family HTH domain
VKIVLLSERHAARLLRHFREQLGHTRRAIGSRMFVSAKTIANRETGTHGIATDALIDHFHVVGFDLAIFPSRHPGARPTGTGWPE